MRGHSTAARLIQSQQRKSSLKEREDVISVFLTEEAEQLEPAEVLLAAVLLLLAVCRQVPQMMKLKQVDDSDVDQLLSAEGFLQDQPLHTAQFTQSSTDAPSPRPSLSLSPPLSPHPAPLSTPHPLSTSSPHPAPLPAPLLSPPLSTSSPHPAPLPAPPGTAPPVSPSERPVYPDSCSGKRDRGT